MLNFVKFISYLDTDMLPAREVTEPSVMNETQDTGNRGIVWKN